MAYLVYYPKLCINWLKCQVAGPPRLSTTVADVFLVCSAKQRKIFLVLTRAKQFARCGLLAHSVHCGPTRTRTWNLGFGDRCFTIEL